MIVPGLGVDAGGIGIVGAGEDAVMVAGQDHVDPVHGGQRDRGVFHPVLVCSAAPMPEWRQRDDDLGALLAHLRHPGLRGFDDVARLTLPSRWRRSQFMICGGTKPMIPMRIGWLSPAPSVIIRSRMT
jgi:hypothetical protein